MFYTTIKPDSSIEFLVENNSFHSKHHLGCELFESELLLGLASQRHKEFLTKAEKITQCWEEKSETLE